MKPEAASFIELAREDLAVAKTLLEKHRRHAAFAVEQAAEKLLKAVLATEGISFTTRNHQLGALAQLLPADHLWRADLMAFDSLTGYATMFRYPTPGGGVPWEPDRKQVAEAWQMVSALVGEIEDWCREQSP